MSRNISVWVDVIGDDGAPPPEPALLRMPTGTDGECADFIDGLLKLSQTRPKLYFHVSWSLRKGFALVGSGAFSAQDGTTYFENHWGEGPQVDPSRSAVVS